MDLSGRDRRLKGRKVQISRDDHCYRLYITDEGFMTRGKISKISTID